MCVDRLPWCPATTLLFRLPSTGLILDRDSAAKAVVAAAAAASVTSAASAGPLMAGGAPTAASKHHHQADSTGLLALAGSCIVSVGRGRG